jgi:hypothetical protein
MYRIDSLITVQVPCKEKQKEINAGSQGEDMLAFFNLFHTHYWGPPRRRQDGVHYMTCYECGKNRKLKVDIDKDNRLARVDNREKAGRAA